MERHTDDYATSNYIVIVVGAVLVDICLVAAPETTAPGAVRDDRVALMFPILTCALVIYIACIPVGRKILGLPENEQDANGDDRLQSNSSMVVEEV